jgi:hypothetical protein
MLFIFYNESITPKILTITTLGHLQYKIKLLLLASIPDAVDLVN